MVLVKIKKSSIKKNPNAGRADFEVLGPWNASGQCHGSDLPDYLLPLIQITSTQMGDYPTYDFQFIEPLTDELMTRLRKEKNISIEVNRDATYCQSMFPEPEYTYKYHNPIIMCSNCEHEARLNKIPKDYIINEDGEEFEVDVCPVCSEHNTFQYKYQSINEVI